VRSATGVFDDSSDIQSADHVESGSLEKRGDGREAKPLLLNLNFVGSNPILRRSGDLAQALAFGLWLR
jgi:hypothetical protein